MKKWSAIIGFWLCWGFALGTLLLLGPLRMVVNYARQNTWSELQERLVVLLLIAILAAVSFILARFTARTVTNAEKKRNTRMLHTAVPIIAAAAALYIMMNPALVNADNSASTNLTTQFTIGPYPDDEKMDKLEDEGFTTIVSLLHPAVVPFEPKLLNEEIENAKKHDLQVVNIPMLPWISDNTSAIDSFRSFVRTHKGKCYIHCYLGKDRVNVARRIIEQENATALNMDKGIGRRSMETVKTFERGVVYKLGEGVWLSPMPTKEEYIGYVVATDFKQVVSISDPSEPEANTSNAKEQVFLNSYRLPYRVFHVTANADDKRIKQVVDSIKQLPKPVFVHCFKTDEPVAQAILRMYNAQ